MKARLGQNYMITIDCKDVEPILNELAIYVSDQIAAIPAIQLHKFVLAPIVDDEPINHAEVVTSIKEFLESIGEQRNFAVITKGDIISIESISGKVIEREATPKADLFSCPHCGFITQYEVDYNTHMKIHYL